MSGIISDNTGRSSGLLKAVAAGGGLTSMQVFTSSGTWTKPSGIGSVKVTVVGGGGGGASGANTTMGGGAGGGGGAAIELIDVSGTSSETVTIGAGGGARTGANEVGIAGGTSSFGSFCSATGGTGGGPANSNGSGSAGGAGSGGDINITGSGGDCEPTFQATYTGNQYSPQGGASIFCGVEHVLESTNPSGASSYGCGGNGSRQGASVSAAATDGIIIVEEYA